MTHAVAVEDSAGLTDAVRVTHEANATLVGAITAEATVEVFGPTVTVDEIDHAEQSLATYATKAGRATTEAARYIVAAQAILKAGRWAIEHWPS